MAHPLTVPAIGVLALAGIGAGIQLGHSAVAEINPIYFEGAPTRFHAELTPSGYRPGENYARLQDTAGQLDLGTGCVGCRSYPEEYYPVHDASVTGYESGYGAEADAPPVEFAALRPEAAEAQARREAALAQVELYARGSQPADGGVAYAVAEAAAEEASVEPAVE